MNFIPELLQVSDPEFFTKALPSHESTNDRFREMVSFKEIGHILCLKTQDFFERSDEYPADSIEIVRKEENGDIPFLHFRDSQEEKFIMNIYYCFIANRCKKFQLGLTSDGFTFMNNYYFPLINKETNQMEKLLVNISKKYIFKVKQRISEGVSKVELCKNKIVLDGEKVIHIEQPISVILQYYQQGFVFNEHLFKFDGEDGCLSVYEVEVELIFNCMSTGSLLEKVDQTKYKRYIEKDDYRRIFKNITEDDFVKYDEYQVWKGKYDENIKKYGLAVADVIQCIDINCKK
jgi:hypothetical protein